MNVKPWADGMKMRFYNLEDSCCPIGKTLKPIKNLCHAVEIIEYYRMTLNVIRKKGEYQIGEVAGEREAAKARRRGYAEGRSECAAIAEAALDRGFSL